MNIKIIAGETRCVMLFCLCFLQLLNIPHNWEQIMDFIYIGIALSTAMVFPAVQRQVAVTHLSQSYHYLTRSETLNGPKGGKSHLCNATFKKQGIQWSVLWRKDPRNISWSEFANGFFMLYGIKLWLQDSSSKPTDSEGCVYCCGYSLQLCLN